MSRDLDAPPSAAAFDTWPTKIPNDDFHDGDSDEDYIAPYTKARDDYDDGGLQFYSEDDVNADVFEELRLQPDQVECVQAAWARFLQAAETTEAAGDAMCAAILDAAPRLQPLFRTPRAVLGMRLVGAVSALVDSLGDPSSLKHAVETLAFQHIQVDVTTPHVMIFRDALADLLLSELGRGCTDAVLAGFRTLLNYVGGCIIYVRKTYADRLGIIAASWAEATRPRRASSESDADTEFGSERPTVGAMDVEPSSSYSKKARRLHHESRSKAGACIAMPAGAQPTAKALSVSERSRCDRNITVPRTFPEMFRFNASVMDVPSHPWMNEVLAAFDAIVGNIANAARLQEECDVLAVKLSKLPGSCRLHDFQTVLLASLRSLNSKAWDSDHEVAWIWLWGIIERLLKPQLGKPARFGRALVKMLGALSERDRHFFLQKIIATFFDSAPTSQDHFRQSTTRLHFIVDKVVSMTAEIYRRPGEVVFGLGALGLRHVGYGVPFELFGPFVSAAVEAATYIAPNADALDAFRWSLGLIARVLMRVVLEGSTVVMRAINANSAKQLLRAVACAPRSCRSEWVLCVTVASESISPLMWALERGCIDAAEAILRDLLTIRADRERYYYGVDALFSRHPDIVRRLCADAPSLLWTLLDGLVWRSRTAEDGQRRAAYFCKHILVRPDGRPASVLEDICQCADPKLVRHPVVAHLIDLVWAKVAMRTFLGRNAVLMMTLVFYTFSQAVLDIGTARALDAEGLATRFAVAFCRSFVYGLFLPTHVAAHLRLALCEFRTGRTNAFGGVKVPAHLGKHVKCYTLAAILTVMLALDPVVHCLGETPLLTQHCHAGESITPLYTVFSMLGVLSLYMMASDFCVFSIGIAAFILMFNRVMHELLLFLFGFGVLTLAFATAAAALKSGVHGFATIADCAAGMLDVFMETAHDEDRESIAEVPMLRFVVLVFYFLSSVYLLNLLVARLAGGYIATFSDIVGFARLKRGAKVIEAIKATPRARWAAFVRSLHLDSPVRFCEGDDGMPGAIEVMEAAAAGERNVEAIRRYGGSTSPDAVWPEDESARTDSAEDRLEKIESLVRLVAKRQVQSLQPRRGGGGDDALSRSICSSDSSGGSRSSPSSEER